MNKWTDRMNGSSAMPEKTVGVRSSIVFVGIFVFEGCGVGKARLIRPIVGFFFPLCQIEMCGVGAGNRLEMTGNRDCSQQS